MQLFIPGKPFYKGNLHMHTTVSDGKLTPEDAMDRYWRGGYDFIAITDHWKPSVERWHKGMLCLPGVEIDYNLPGQVIHIVGVGMGEGLMDRVKPRQSAQSGVDIINEEGGRAILAHPSWSLNTPEIIGAMRGLAAAEVYNAVSGFPWNAGRADSTGILDIAAAQGHMPRWVASDDSHFYNGEECSAFIRIQADSLAREDILAALDKGLFYASRGPSFRQAELTEDRLIVECEPVSRIAFASDLPYVAGRVFEGEGLTRAEYPLQLHRRERFVRCAIYDDKGRQAWLSPIPLSGL
ncbi:MAG: hypothetical protein LBH66_00970 [Oscillospiraceae bacterium]|nr:hypothetical protein [Oscillospiraceae bacterium]